MGNRINVILAYPHTNNTFTKKQLWKHLNTLSDAFTIKIMSMVQSFNGNDSLKIKVTPSLDANSFLISIPTRLESAKAATKMSGS